MQLLMQQLGAAVSVVCVRATGSCLNIQHWFHYRVETKLSTENVVEH